MAPSKRGRGLHGGTGLHGGRGLLARPCQACRTLDTQDRPLASPVERPKKTLAPPTPQPLA